MSDSTTADGRRSSGPFRVGDRVQLTGPKGRMNTITLEPGKLFHSHRGVLAHDAIIGLPDGSVVVNNAGVEHLALRPLLNDFVMSMPRGAAIIYPKDAAQILALADIFPGATVVEAGVGSGALSLWLLRAIGPEGRLLSFERRDEFADVARANAATFLGSDPENWTVTVGDLQEQLTAAVEPASVDRVVLDMLAPWETLDAVTAALKPGGVVLCYVATVTQLSRVAEAIRATGDYTHPQSSETMVRGWHVEGLAVRPDHRMIAHTGFLITARRLAPGTVLPELKRRPSKSDYDDADVEAWTPGALGERQSSPKSLRKRMREAEASATLARDGAAEDATVDAAEDAAGAESAGDERDPHVD
jgi:tRNA (adenine57-N1/adenine58-N1)-methyltransferase